MAAKKASLKGKSKINKRRLRKNENRRENKEVVRHTEHKDDGKKGTEAFPK